MPFQVQVQGGDAAVGDYGATPDEAYGVGEWGPAIMGPANQSGNSDAEESTFTTAELARTMRITLVLHRPSLAFRVVEV